MGETNGNENAASENEVNVSTEEDVNTTTSEEENATQENEASEESLDARLREIEKRERAIEIQERRIKAVEVLKNRGLPGNLIDLLDLHDDDTLEKSIELAARARNTPNVPRDAEFTGPEAPDKKASYKEFLEWMETKKG